MTWTVQEIEKDWLGGRINALALEPEVVVAAFRRVEEQLGRSWIEQARISERNVVLGTGPTQRVVTMGRRLAALDGVARSGRLIEKIRCGDSSARAELTAIYLVRYKPEVQVELEPPVGTRLADFRVREKDSPWTYVEVTFPGRSQARERAQMVLGRVTSLVDGIKKTFGLEVFLRREPDKAELSKIIGAITSFCNQEGPSSEELPGDLGQLLLNNAAAVDDDNGDGAPIVAVTRAIVGPPHRQITVSMACADHRARNFLDSEASQLPKDAPGLIMIGALRVPVHIPSWEADLKQQFELGLHDRVSGICLFWGALRPKWLLQTRLLLNPHAKFALPTWLDNALVDAGAEFRSLTQVGHDRRLKGSD